MCFDTAQNTHACFKFAFPVVSDGGNVKAKKGGAEE